MLMKETRSTRTIFRPILQTTTPIRGLRYITITRARRLTNQFRQRFFNRHVTRIVSTRLLSSVPRHLLRKPYRNTITLGVPKVVSRGFFIPIRLNRNLNVRILVTKMGFTLTFNVVKVLTLPRVTTMRRSLFICRHKRFFQNTSKTMLRGVNILSRQRLQTLTLPRFRHVKSNNRITRRQRNTSRTLLVNFSSAVIMYLARTRVVNCCSRLLTRDYFLHPCQFEWSTLGVLPSILQS